LPYYEKTQAFAGVFTGVSRAPSSLTPDVTIRISPLIQIIDLDQAILARANYHMRQIAAIRESSKTGVFQVI
jgi:hypothetical protein